MALSREWSGQSDEKYRDRLVFGTDFTYTTGELRSMFRTLETLDEHYYNEEYSDYVWPFYGLGLLDGVLKKIYRENALRISAKARNGAS
jgi:predicted TIM-barrel fold metal-dependent hydrolase